MSPVSSAAGELQYFFASQFDVTERRDALQLKTALLHEVDHRVKNNLQMVTALISMQAATITDPIVQQSLGTMMQRIEALSTVHRRLYQSDDVTRFSVAEFVHDIVSDLVSASGRRDIGVRLDLEPTTVLADKAAPLVLMVNEVVTNALKHAFTGGRSGTVTAAVKRIEGRLRIEIADDGVGMSPQPDGVTSFGKTLVHMLARQLRADVTWNPTQPSGTLVRFELPA
ncbi:Blue-light-activated histidine kinase 2 [Methylobacterium aerolatum]|nr:Blue-light-activated histidine kinase 2 [Methylobacterium aerolatum]